MAGQHVSSVPGKTVGAESVRRSWLPWAGVAAGLLGAIATLASGIDVPAADRRADPVTAAAEGFDGAASTLRIAAALALLAAALVVAFAADLRRRLSGHTPPRSVVPSLAWAGGLLTAASLVAAGVVAATAATLVDDGYRESTLEVFTALLNNVAFAAWAPAALAMGAVAYAGVRHAAVPGWLAGLSALGTIAMVAVIAIGLPFASWAIATPWLVIAGATLALSNESTVPVERPAAG